MLSLSLAHTRSIKGKMCKAFPFTLWKKKKTERNILCNTGSRENVEFIIDVSKRD